LLIVAVPLLWYNNSKITGSQALLPYDTILFSKSIVELGVVDTVNARLGAAPVLVVALA